MVKRLNPKIALLARQVNAILKQEACIQDYLQYHQEMERHVSLKNMEKELHELHQKFHQGDETLYRQYQHKKDIYQQHPLVCNYQYSKEEAIALMEHVRRYISTRLTK